MLKKTIMGVLTTIMGVLILTGCGNNLELYKSVKKFADINCENGSIVDVALSDFTDFDWDEALVFNYPTSMKEIEDAIGVKYDGLKLDLNSGIIFVKDKKMVYDEIFIQKYDGIDPLSRKFYISISKDMNSTQKYKVFTPDSVFECSKAEPDYYRLEAKE